MKKLIKSIGMIAFAGLSLVSCSKDDDNGFSVSDEQLVGQWNFSKERFAINGVWSAEEDYSGNEASAACPDFLKFNVDHTGIGRDYGSDCDSFYDSAAAWTRSGNTLTVVEGGDTITYNVTALSSTAMTIEESYTEAGMTIIDQYTFVKAN